MTSDNSKVIAPAMQSKKTNQRRTTEQFILEAIAAHGDRYDYSKTIYINAKTKVLITCKEHGDFYVFVHTHLNGGICRKCSNEITSKTIASKKEKPTTRRKTTHEVVSEFQLVHGEKYDYSKVFYINNREKVEIICKEHGSFYQTAKSHKNGCGCPDCGVVSRVGKRKKAIDNVISCFVSAHGFRYKYHKVKYLGAMKKVCIECPDHGDFWKTPADHQSGHGCPKCKSNNTSKIFRKGQNHFLKKFKEAHGNRYDYSLAGDNLASKDVIRILCKDHGIFEQQVMSHALGYGCQKCGGVHRHDTKSFIKISNKVHKGRYDYSNVVYVNNRTKVLIGCPVHGIFKQTPHSHLKGSGCQLCALNNNSYKRQDYIDLCNKKGGMSKLYLIQCHNESESFYKVGITRMAMSDRFSGRSMPYEYEIVKIIENGAAFIWDLEKKLHRFLKEHRYKPSIAFAGESECFSHIPKEILRLLDKVNGSSQLQLIA